MKQKIHEEKMMNPDKTVSCIVYSKRLKLRRTTRRASACILHDQETSDNLQQFCLYSESSRTQHKCASIKEKKWHPQLPKLLSTPMKTTSAGRQHSAIMAIYSSSSSSSSAPMATSSSEFESVPSSLAASNPAKSTKRSPFASAATFRQ